MSAAREKATAIAGALELIVYLPGANVGAAPSVLLANGLGVFCPESTLTRNLFIRTYGCQMNIYDSDRMADVLAPLGYTTVDCPEDADMIILNTCHIREKAAEKVYSELGRLRRMKLCRTANNPDRGGPILAVAGCVAQAEGTEMLARAPFLDIVFGPQTYHRLPEMIARAEQATITREWGAGILDIEFPAAAKFDHLPSVKLKAPSTDRTAFLTIQEGCDKFCAFCVVPYTRGVEYSRPGESILTECRQLVDGGVREVTLLGQNVNAYHGTAPSGGTWELAELIEQTANIDGLQRIRYTTSHPRDMDEQLLQTHGSCDKLMPYLHLPAQSGSDSILAAMNRGYTSADYLAIVARLRDIRPDIALSSDFIVGFPGETDEDFEATMDFVRCVTFAQAYSFKYSPRPGTPAALMENQVPDDVCADRLLRLRELLDFQQKTFNQDMVGRHLPILLDRVGRRPGQLVGRSPFMQAVHIDSSSNLLGKIVDVTIDAAHANSLAGHLHTRNEENAPTPLGKVS